MKKERIYSILRLQKEWRDFVFPPKGIKYIPFRIRQLFRKLFRRKINITVISPQGVRYKCCDCVSTSFGHLDFTPITENSNLNFSVSFNFSDFKEE